MLTSRVPDSSVSFVRLLSATSSASCNWLRSDSVFSSLVVKEVTWGGGGELVGHSLHTLRAGEALAYLMLQLGDFVVLACNGLRRGSCELLESSANLVAVLKGG